MNWINILLPGLGLIAGLAKALADSQAHGSPRLARWFPKWAGPESWRLKWRGGDKANGPAFFLSSTMLVALTDLWHAANLLAWLAADAAVVLLAWGRPAWWWAVGYVVVRRVVFEPMYAYLRK